MNKSLITKCQKCGEYWGTIQDKQAISGKIVGYCQCDPRGWETCKRHEGNVRRRFKSVRIYNLQGDYTYINFYSMTAPCKPNYCITQWGLAFLTH